MIIACVEIEIEIEIGTDSCPRDHRDHRGTSPFLSESNPGEMAAVSSMAKGRISLCPLCPLWL